MAKQTRKRTPKKATDPAAGEPIDWAIAFLERLAKTGNVAAAAKKAGIRRQATYERRQTDQEFAALWKEAIDIAVDALELEARRRAATGTLKPVFHKGATCGHVREFSDTLLIFLLKAHRPEKFRDKVQIQHGGDPNAPPIGHKHDHGLTPADIAAAAALVAAAGLGVCADGGAQSVDPAHAPSAAAPVPAAQ